MAALFADLRHAARGLARSPGFTTVAVLSLALGIGANATIFSLVSAFLLRPLAGASQPAELVRLGLTRRGSGFSAFSLPEYRLIAAETAAFQGVAAFLPSDLTFRIGDTAESGWGEMVSANYFDVLGVRPDVGRTFLPEEDRAPGGNAVTVISHSLWQTRFSARPDAPGQTLHINGKPFTIVGVAPPGFRGAFAGFEMDLWVPLSMQAVVQPVRPELLERMDSRFLMLLARRRAGVAPAQAQAALDTLAARMASEHPETNQEAGIALAPATGLHPAAAQLAGAFLALLMGIVALVLLMACANVAGLLLARGAARRREIAVRIALGAGRWRLLRQLLTESLLLSLAGGGAGVLFAVWATGLLQGFRPPTDVPIALDTSVDPRVLGFTLALTLLTGVVCGLMPAWQATRPDVVPALKGDAPSGKRSRLRSVLVVAQVAVSLVLLVGAGLLVRSLGNAATMSAGFDSSNLFVMAFEPQRIGYSMDRAKAFYEEMAARLATRPDVTGVTYALAVPLGDRGGTIDISLEGQDLTPESRGTAVVRNVVVPGYFETMGIPLAAGRDFSDQDTVQSPGVVIINETFARRFFTGAPPVGKRLHRRNLSIWGDRGPALEIVAVARDIKYRSLGEEPRPAVYLHYPQQEHIGLILHARTTGPPGPAMATGRAIVRQLDPDLPVSDVRIMDEAMAFSLVPARLAGSVLGFAGAVALALAAIGISSVVAYWVSQRTREIGVRMALGAQPRQVLRLVAGQGLRLTLLGIALGLAGTLAAARALRSILIGVGPADPVTYAGVSVLLVGVALAAALAPAWRAARVDPVVALRHE